MKQFMSEKKGRMHVQRTLKNMKITKPSMETEPEIGAHDINERDIVDETKSAVLLTLTEKKKTVMSKLLKAMTLLCFIYDIDFKKLVKKSNSGIGEVVSVDVDIVLANSP